MTHFLFGKGQQPIEAEVGGASWMNESGGAVINNKEVPSVCESASTPSQPLSYQQSASFPGAA